MARPIKHRGKYRIRWQDAAGRRRSACFTSYSAAERALRKFQAEADDLRAGLVDPVAKAAARKSFDDLADYWLDHVAVHKRSDKDDRSILRWHLRPALGGRLLSALEPKRRGLPQLGRQTPEAYITDSKAPRAVAKSCLTCQAVANDP